MTKKKIRTVVAGGAAGNMLGWMREHLAKKGADEIEVVAAFGTSHRGDLKKEALLKTWSDHGVDIVPPGHYAGLMRGRGPIDLVVSCANKGKATRDIFTGVAGVWEACGNPRRFVDMATLGCSTVEAAYAYGQQKGIEYCNVPVTGGETGARNGTMVILFGGSTESYAFLKRVLFQYIGVPRHDGESHLGGTLAKLANQIKVLVQLLSESMAVALDSVKMRGGSLRSTAQHELFDALSQGAGGGNQWARAVALGVKDDIWEGSGFLSPHAAIDAFLAAEAAIEAGLPRFTVNVLLGMGVSLAHLVKTRGPRTGTQGLVRELYGEAAQALQDAIDNNGFEREPQTLDALECAICSLPTDLHEAMGNDITVGNFGE